MFDSSLLNLSSLDTELKSLRSLRSLRYLNKLENHLIHDRLFFNLVNNLNIRMGNIYLNNPSLFFIFGLFGFLKSFSFVSLVVPFLPEGSVDFVLLYAVKKSNSNGLDSLDKWWKSIHNSTGIDFLIIFRSIVEDS